jgi:hypothetical protein
MSDTDQKEQVADRPHNWTISLSIAAILLSLLSAAVSMYSSHIAHLQYNLAVTARDAAKKAEEKQAANTEKSLRTAEDSLREQKTLAGAMLSNLELSTQQFHTQYRPWLQVAGVDTRAPIPGNVVKIFNRGTAQASNTHVDCFVVTTTWTNGDVKRSRKSTGLMLLDDLLTQESG